jgi:Carboxypeptidase regulatory-like domain
MYTLAQLLFAVGSLTSLSPLPDTSARISGYALSAYNGRPLAGVMITVPELQRFALTDAHGGFTIAGLQVGRRKVRVSYEGRVTSDYEFALRAGATVKIAVVLDAQAEDLAAIVVEERYVDLWRDLAGFYERRKQYSGYARFYTREDIDRTHPEAISTLLRGAGIFEWCVYTCLPTRFSGGRICTVPISVDGFPIWERDYDKIPIENVAGVEIYRDPSTSGSPFGQPKIGQFGFDGKDVIQGRGNCGSVGIWTR